MAKLLCGICFTVGLLIATGCTQANRGNREEELKYLRVAVSEKHLDYASIEVADRSNIQIVEEGANPYLSLKLFPGQAKRNNGIRSELSVDFPFKEGDVVNYKWRMRLAKDFGADPKNLWWVIGQLHDQPNRDRGESWDGFPSHSPTVLVSYGNLKGKDHLGFTYGAPDLTDIGSVPIAREEWIELRMRIRFSTKEDGFAEIFVGQEKEPRFKAKGRNMHNDFQHYWKVGMYRHPEINTKAEMHIDDLSVEIE